MGRDKATKFPSQSFLWILLLEGWGWALPTLQGKQWVYPPNPTDPPTFAEGHGHLHWGAMPLHLVWSTPILPSSWVINLKCNSVQAEDMEATAFSIVEMDGYMLGWAEVVLSPVSHDGSKEVWFTTNRWRQFHGKMLHTGYIGHKKPTDYFLTQARCPSSFLLLPLPCPDVLDLPPLCIPAFSVPLPVSDEGVSHTSIISGAYALNRSCLTGCG